jgi:hypothetical protein
MQICGSTLAIGAAGALTLAAVLSKRDGSAAISLEELRRLASLRGTAREQAEPPLAPTPMPRPSQRQPADAREREEQPAPSSARRSSQRQPPAAARQLGERSAPTPAPSPTRRQAGGIAGLPSLSGVTVTFTGFRDKDLALDLMGVGATPSDNFTRATGLVVALDPQRVTGKVKQARDKGIPVVSADALRDYVLRAQSVGRAQSPRAQRPRAQRSSDRAEPEPTAPSRSSSGSALYGVGETLWFDGVDGPVEVTYRGRSGGTATIILDGYQMSVPLNKLSRLEPDPRPSATAGPAPARQRRPRGGDPIRGGVLLAKKFDGQDPVGMMASEKLDGVRAYWNGEGFYSRNGNLFEAPSWMLDLLPDEDLDGELYLGPGQLYEAISIVKTKPPTHAWRKLRYMVFDAPDAAGPFRERLKHAERLVDEACRRWRGPGPCPVQLVQHTLIRSPQDLDRFHREVTSRGIEGTMLRDPDSRYERTRSGTLLKLKDFQDGNAEVIGYKKGATAAVGSYQMRDLDNGAVFTVDARHAPAGRRGALLPVGTQVEYRFQERTPNGNPRHPILIGVRDYE